MVQKKLPLEDRHVIKEAMADIDSSGIVRTKAGKGLQEGIMRVKERMRIAAGLGEEDILKEIEARNWKTAIWITIEIGPKEDASKRVARLLVEIYKSECGESEADKRYDQWITYVKEVCKGVFNAYDRGDGVIPDELGDMLVEAVEIATKVIERLELEKAEVAR